MANADQEVHYFSSQDIQAWVAQKRLETERLDFKERYGRSDKDKREFLKDITAMANSSGGTLVIGVSDKRDRADKVVGVGDNDLQIQDMENLIRDCVHEPLLGWRIYPVLVQEDRDDVKTVVVVEVPASFSKPHMFEYGGRTHKYFYRRSGRNNNPMSMSEIRNAVLEQESAVRRLEEFRKQRAAVLDGRAQGHPALLVSATPVPVDVQRFTAPQAKAFLENKRVSLKDRRGEVIATMPVTRYYAGLGYSINGALIDVDGIEITELWRSGYFEFSITNLDDHRFFRRDRENALVSHMYELPALLVLLSKFASMIATEAAAYNLVEFRMMLRRCSGMHLSFEDPLVDPPQGRIRADEEVDIRYFAYSPEDFGKAAKHVADVLFNGFGASRCPMVDESGQWTW